MTVIGYSTLSVVPEVKGLRQALEKQTSGDLTAAGKRGGQRYGDAAGASAAAGFKGKFSGAMKGFAPLAGLVGGAGLVAGFKDVIGQASQAQQAVGGVQAVFKEYADGVIQDSTRAAESLGLSSRAYQELVTVSGALLKNKGLTDFANQARTLVTVGADLAAQFGGSTQQAVEALNAALRGESDPIERYAISLNETAIKAELAAKGQSKLTGAALDQAKTQARLSLILQQSADAQGAFGRESDTLAGSQARLSAQWADMRAELGENLLPAMTTLAATMNSDVLPALAGAGGVAKEAAQAFGSIPTPVYAGAAAFAALRLAAVTSLGAVVAGGVAAVGSSMQGLALRTMLAKDAFVAARTASITTTGALAGVSLGAGRAAASMAALRAASVGAGAGLSRMSGFVGGPWGAAFIAGTAILTKFYSQNQKVKSQIEAMKGTFEAQTGEFTAETAKQALGVIGDEWLKYAKDIGISMEDLTKAAVEGGPALDAFKAKYGDILRKDDSIESFTSQIEDANKVVRLSQVAFAATKEGVDGYVSGLKDADRAAHGSSSATRDLSSSMDEYQRAMQGARGEIRKLIDAEKARASAAIQNRRDAIGLRESLRSAREEAREGNRVLLDGSKAADANMSALLDLADQWATSTPKARAAIGGYEAMRTEFIKVADSMGVTESKAADLADELLKMPRKHLMGFESRGYRERLAELKALSAAAAKIPRSIVIAYQSQATNQQGALEDRKYASGGMIGGYGSGTSDSNLIWASRGEFVQRKRAVDYYGPEFMRKLNALQVPKLPGYAQGGIVQSAPAVVPAAGVQVNIGEVRAHDYRDFMGQMQRRAREAQGGGVPA